MSLRFLAICALLVTPFNVAGQGIDEATGSRIDTALTAIFEELGIVGLQVAIGMDGTLAWTGSYGMADLEHSSPVTDETLFRTASISKWMTATAALRLAELDKLDLDAPVQEYCPQYSEKEWGLTARDLLGHRGGMRQYWGYNDEPREKPEQEQELQKNIDEEQLWMTVRYTDVIGPVNRFKDDPLLFEPGSDYHYTSLGYRLLGCVIRGAADLPFNEVMQEHIFGPAGMSSTRNDDAYAIISGRARGYTSTHEGELRRSRFRDVSENLAAGGHLSTASDLARFALAWNTGQLVSEASMEAMTAPPADDPAAKRYSGFGVLVGLLPDKRVLFSGGMQDGTRTYLVLNSTTGRVFAWMTNFEGVPSNFNMLMLTSLKSILDE